MSNETKQDVFNDLVEQHLNYVITVVGDYGVKDKAIEGWNERYDAALPDDLPVIPKKVSQEIKVAYTKYSVTDELNWANQDALPDPEVSDWIKDNEALFAEAWGRGLWVVEQTGKAESYD